MINNSNKIITALNKITISSNKITISSNKIISGSNQIINNLKTLSLFQKLSAYEIKSWQLK
jgi:hypothetical protein